MKKIMMLFAVSLFTVNSFAALNQTEIISERVVTVSVDISETSLRHSRSGYSAELVKILIPGLADVTLLDHRNSGEAAPCMATYETNNIVDIVQNNPVIESLPMKITLSKIPIINNEENICEIMLIELVESKIRGFRFIHSREQVIASRSVEDCR